MERLVPVELSRRPFAGLSVTQTGAYSDGYGGSTYVPGESPPAVTQDAYNDHPEVSPSHFFTDSLDMYINTECQRRCQHCFLGDEQLSDKSAMGLDLVSDISHWARKGGPSESLFNESPFRSITLLGGEPTLHPDFPNIVQVLAGDDWKLRLVTNGGNRRLADLLDANQRILRLFEMVSLSVDGPDEASNDAIRGGNTFQNQLTLASRLREAEVPFGINYTPLRSTVRRAREMMDFAIDVGAQRLNIHLPSQVGRAAVYAADEIPERQEWLDLVSDVEDHANPSITRKIRLDVQLGHRSGRPEEVPGGCKIRDRSNLQIFPNGDAIACGLSADQPHRGAYVFANKWLRFRNKKGDERYRADEDFGACPIDPSKDLCMYNRTMRSEVDF